jgi:hypothetical protein
MEWDLKSVLNLIQTINDYYVENKHDLTVGHIDIIRENLSLDLWTLSNNKKYIYKKILSKYIRTIVGHSYLYWEIEEAIQGFCQACSDGT